MNVLVKSFQSFQFIMSVFIFGASKIITMISISYENYTGNQQRFLLK
jgi:hypothetical protein